MKKRRISLLSVAMLAFTMTACTQTVQSDQVIEETWVQNSTEAREADSIEENKNELEAAEVAQVVDGDTIRILRGEEKVTIRMIGIDTPESVHPDKSKNTVFGEEASEFTKSYFTQGQIIYLEKDVSDTDKYGRLLRYIWLELPKDSQNEEEIRTKMFNALAVSEGYANAYYYAPDTKNYELFSQLEWEAYTSKSGLWMEEGLNDETIKNKEKKEKISESDGHTILYIGNKNSKKFHLSTCSNLPKESNTTYFDNREDAVDTGYAPCGICHP